MTATDSAVIADRVTDVPKFQVHYRNAGEGHPVVLLHGRDARRPTSVRTSVPGGRSRASTPSAQLTNPTTKANSERHTS
jgi:hypothetical protein